MPGNERRLRMAEQIQEGVRRALATTADKPNVEADRQAIADAVDEFLQSYAKDRDTSLDRISAGQLRAMGFSIDTEVPDCATIRRNALKPVTKSSAVDLANGILSLGYEITEPFEWFSVTGTISD